jgi:hypothetical protein
MIEMGNTCRLAAAQHRQLGADSSRSWSKRCATIDPNLMDYNHLSTQPFLAAVSPCSGERGTIRFNRTPIAHAARGAAASAKGTQSNARNTEPGSRPLSSPLALATSPAVAAPKAISAW